MEKALTILKEYLDSGEDLYLAARKAAARMQFSPAGLAALVKEYKSRNEQEGWTR